jgi:dipeptidase
VFSLAKDLGFWNEGQPFVWRDAYGMPGSRENSLREWRVLSLAAPSLNLKATGDALVDRYPFSVKPDRPMDVKTLMTVMRDGYQGTEFDLTEHPAFHPGGKDKNRPGDKNKKSPLARPWGPPELFDLLGLKPERAINTPTSGYVFVAQLRDWLPDPVGHCLWFAYGPAYTSCFAPVYAGVTDLPDAWDHPADFTNINRTQTQWNFRLVHSLANNLRHQDAVRDIQKVYAPAEERFFATQTKFEKAATEVFQRDGVPAAEAFVTEYTQQSLKQVGYAYDELVDYLMFQYLLGDADVAPPTLPVIGASTVLSGG